MDSEASITIPNGDYNNIPLTKSMIPTTETNHGKVDADDQFMSFEADELSRERGIPGATEPVGGEADKMRVTWTDLAKGKTNSGRRKKESDAADYSLARHNEKNANDIEAIDEEDDMLSNAPSGSQNGGDGADDDEAPQEFKSKYVRRNTLAR